MSAPHIWGFDRDDTEMRAALSAGWRRSDLAWERLMERGNEALRAGSSGRAWRMFVAAGMLARLRFGRDDPRRATALGARAVLLERAGAGQGATALRDWAIADWARVGDFVDGMGIRPRARSSLFHLRMEARHRDTFQANLRTRFGRIAAETAETLAAIGTPDRPGHRHYARWLGERPGVFDDTRKLLAACLLLPDRTAAGDGQGPGPKGG